MYKKTKWHTPARWGRAAVLEIAAWGRPSACACARVCAGMYVCVSPTKHVRVCVRVFVYMRMRVRAMLVLLMFFFFHSRATLTLFFGYLSH